MAGIQIHREPEDAYRRYAPLGPAGQLFVTGDPIGMTNNQLVDCDDNDSEILKGEIIGFACEPATGPHAGSRVTSAADGFGAAENQMRSYYPFNAPGLELRTRNFWATGGGNVQTEKEGTEIGDIYVMTSPAAPANTWGIEQTASTIADAGEEAAGDTAEFMIVAILDENMNPIDADATVALGTAPAAGQGWVVFRPIKMSQNEFGGA